MAKRKEGTATETTDQAKATTGAKKTTASKGATPEHEATATPKKGRPKKTESAVAEMGAPVTEKVSKAAAGKTKAKGSEASAADASAAPKTAKKGSAKKAGAAADEAGVPIPVATSDVVQELVVPKVKGRSTKKSTEEQQPEQTMQTNENQTSADQQQTEEQKNIYHDVSRFTEFDIYLFREGRHYTLYDKLGSHVMEHNGRKGTYFAVWAPNAEQVAVMGDFNWWNRESHPLQARSDGSGVWEGFVPDVGAGMLYKYQIKSRYHLYQVEKSDPFAFAREVPPQTASIVTDLDYSWKDNNWLESRRENNLEPQPYTVYEMHFGSWRRKPEEDNRSLTYREMAEQLPAYMKEMGYTHVEFMPLAHHPFGGSWGYQITGYFAATSQFGSPEDLMYLIDTLHAEGIGVIMDWVPSHFPSDEHGLAYFDGTHLFEHADPRKGFHPDWNSYIFNYGRNEVRSFLISNALFWLDKYHVDGLRVDAVASMLYLDYSRKHDEWIPNEYGGRENLEAISLLKDFNSAVHEKFPDVTTIAEESTAWPGVTGPVDQGGLGFNMKWMMGWMHDTLDYFSKDSIYRRYHQGEITFSMMYAFSERFMLPLSHDEVVHGKGALLRKMPGDDWQRFANLRTLYAYMYAHPGHKLLFMGGEIGQTTEWNHDSSLEWHLLEYAPHVGIRQLVSELNHVYRQEPSFYTYAFDDRGFEWIDYQDAHNSIISFVRKGSSPDDLILVVCNFTPAVHSNYHLGVPAAGAWREIFNSDDSRYGGSDFVHHATIQTISSPSHGKENSLELKIPPLAVMYFKFEPTAS
ncbi:1,4-alpha-glucan branching protein GlgB [Pontibacter harenae]|uniref:1,4-alpha-glucan branching protein GlgB n=1 Tax=Pontibacter harenae TaxID=2894083 RepID=UPI001E4B7904|nr:1,4-alpha-glucan branching protein GlgB [Pontibacter harenae]MCC9166286.1 1,4-alpha-glucan branching protein GlgB [Pontibacter harenae]